MKKRPKIEKQPRFKAPGPTGGTLVRRVIALLREFDSEAWSRGPGPVYTRGGNLGRDSHILIACSGGLDSTALALLISKYGSRLGSPDRIRLVHVNHGWRAKESDEDQAFVEQLGQRLGVQVLVRRFDPPRKIQGQKSESWEADARSKRKLAFKEWLEEFPGVLLTAHHADDLAETVLWRMGTGAASTHGGGIWVRQKDFSPNGQVLRPFLTTRRAELQEFLEEEKQSWRTDLTNSDPRFMRARLRQTLIPELEAVFPKAIEHLGTLALAAQKGSKTESGRSPLNIANGLAQSGLVLRRSHWTEIGLRVEDKNWTGTIQLTDGWRLVRAPSGSNSKDFANVKNLLRDKSPAAKIAVSKCEKAKPKSLRK